MDDNKTDKRLGDSVREYLVSKGVETPMLFNRTGILNHQQKIQRITENFSDILYVLGLDITDDSLRDTPNRIAKMYMNEIFSGLDYNSFPKCTCILNKMGYNEMIVEKDIRCISTCEHHFVTIDQKCHIAYIPNRYVIGLSKLNRVARFFAKRPQVQERFTEQVFHTLSFILDTPNVAVLTEGKHYCVAQRGVEDQSSITYTSKLGGRFIDDPATRAEFMSLVRPK